MLNFVRCRPVLVLQVLDFVIACPRGRFFDWNLEISQWFDDTFWYIEIHYDISWYVMIYYDILWYILISYDTLWHLYFTLWHIIVIIVSKTEQIWTNRVKFDQTWKSHTNLGNSWWGSGGNALPLPDNLRSWWVLKNIGKRCANGVKPRGLYKVQSRLSPQTRMPTRMITKPEIIGMREEKGSVMCGV